jgi:DNA-binding LacI/PurR family transcriptional regulator
VRKGHQQPTIKDVALIAGVSIQTVSAVLNQKPGITEATAKRVHEAVQRVGYEPYSIARSLRTRATQTIALIISDIANPSFSVMASAAERSALALGYNLVFYNTHDDSDREIACIRAAAQRWVDGILIVSAEDRLPSYEALLATGIHFVPIERVPLHYSGPSVTFNNIEAGRIAARHLLDLGHTRVAHISGPMKLAPARARCEGFQLEIAARNLPACQCIDGGGNWDCLSGYEAMRHVLETRPRPTGIFCANDRIALGAMLAASEAGLSVPGDLSVVGLDNIEVSQYHVPPLTTITQPFARTATEALRLLFDLIQGRKPEPGVVVLEPELVVRGSTGPAPGD